MMSCAENIRKLRRLMCMEQAEFGEHLGLTKSAISHWECGRKHPRIKAIRKIRDLASSKGIEINVEDFLNEDK
jgi:putative transcriptional regulator